MNHEAAKRRWLVAALILAAAFGQGVVAQTSEGVAVTGSGVAYGAPDLAVIDLGVDVADESVEVALQQANRDMNALIEALRAADVAAEDIRTVAFNVWREERFDREGVLAAPQFRVQNSVEVTVRDLDALGVLLSRAVEAGASSIGGIRFSIGDPAALETAAREQAMRAAADKAGQLASLAGVTLGAPLSIDETLAAPSWPPQPFARAEALMADAVPVAGGQLAIRVTVNVRYAIVADGSR